jgi:hypothetical protein
MVKIVAEDEVVAVDGLLGRKSEGYGVAVVGMLLGGKVGRCRGRVLGEACARREVSG